MMRIFNVCTVQKRRNKNKGKQLAKMKSTTPLKYKCGCVTEHSLPDFVTFKAKSLFTMITLTMEKI